MGIKDSGGGLYSATEAARSNPTIPWQRGGPLLLRNMLDGLAFPRPNEVPDGIRYLRANIPRGRAGAGGSNTTRSRHWDSRHSVTWTHRRQISSLTAVVPALSVERARGDTRRRRYLSPTPKTSATLSATSDRTVGRRSTNYCERHRDQPRCVGYSCGIGPRCVGW